MDIVLSLERLNRVLSGHESVHNVVVVTREDAPGQKQLVAYVISKSGEVEGKEAVRLISELRSYVKGKLTDYMVPSVFVLLESFPLNQVGK